MDSPCDLRPPSGPLGTSLPDAGRVTIGASSEEDIQMPKLLIPVVVAILSMGIATLLVLALRPELRAGLGRFRDEGPVELETPAA
jgi:hypothetical protein